ncbi:unnamed protein product [Peniophora sp. CBMAI 1063]|nr:unnamed protein product [Peniophora sp. CBMAI 1063]
MHFGKTYDELLLSLPPEISDGAIEYKRLKKLIHGIVDELESIGLSPDRLRALLAEQERERGPGGAAPDAEHPSPDAASSPSPSPSSSSAPTSPSQPAYGNGNGHARVVYEFAREHDGEGIEPRLRFILPDRYFAPQASGSGISSVDEREHESQSEAESSDDPNLNEPEQERTAEHERSSNVDYEPEADRGEGTSADGARNGVSSSASTHLMNPRAARSPALLYALQRGLALTAAPNNGVRAGARSSASDEARQWNSAPAATQLARAGDLIECDGAHELVVPLAHDTEFFRVLSTALHTLAAHLTHVQADFTRSLSSLASQISASARPLSSSSSSSSRGLNFNFNLLGPGFTPHRAGADASAISTPLLFGRAPALKSDLTAWREIFALYVESEVFERLGERARGERSVADAEVRLKAFAERVTGAGLGDRRTLKLRESREALERFLRLNILLLDLKKFQQANAEAMRKILKKHAKRTALPLPLLTDNASTPDALALFVPPLLHTLPRTLVQAVGTQLLPVIPSLDDYACIICTSIAFKPIRLGCGHLFCVRCLVKLQKRGRERCPVCRAPTVGQATRDNVDWALINFMQDWFPEETWEKMRNNEREAQEEEMREMGIEPGACVVQ